MHFKKFAVNPVKGSCGKRRRGGGRAKVDDEGREGSEAERGENDVVAREGKNADAARGWDWALT